MRLKHIYINKEGEPMANPEMPLPLHFKEEFDYNQDDIEDHADAMKKYHSGLLPFEDREEVLIELEAQAQILKLQPDTLIPVDIEVEVVDQFCLYTDGSNQGYQRKVLRIKP